MIMEDRPEEFEGRLAEGQDWRDVVAWVGDLPPMPQVASRAIKVIEDPFSDAKDLSDILEVDTALATRVLKIANSVMFCRQREVTTLKQAVVMIGMKSLKGIVMAATLRQMKSSVEDVQKIVWEHSVATALMALGIANYLGSRCGDEFFLLGLLHNLGQVVLLSQDEQAKKYIEVLKYIKEHKCTYIEAEQKLFGFAHPLIGALVAKKWNFSSDTCQVILHYQDPIESYSSELGQDYKMMLIRLADMLAHFAALGSPEGYIVKPEDISAVALKLKIPLLDQEQVINDIISATIERFRQECNIYG